MTSLKHYLIEAEASPRIPHPEDSIFDSSTSAAGYVQALSDLARNPQKVSIKWDGGIALIFGQDPNNRFFINDKYMPDAYFAHSPEDWERYDTQIKKSRTARTELYDKLAGLWTGLRTLVARTPGVYKGDLMFAHQLTPVGNEFVFKPVTVEYRVPVNSELGKLIQGRQALIVAHQYNNAPYSGKPLSNSTVTVIPPSLGIDFKIAVPTAQLNAAEQAVRSYGNQVDLFLNGMPKSYRELLKQYLNKKITKQTNEDLSNWLVHNAKPAQIKFLLGEQGYLTENKAGLTALFAIWNAISSLKENLAQQLESQVVGIKQSVAGQSQGEGFVYPSRQGLLKLVQRSGFGAAHFTGFNAKK